MLISRQTWKTWETWQTEKPAKDSDADPDID